MLKPEKIGLNVNGDLPRQELLRRIEIVKDFVDIVWIGDIQFFEDPIDLANFFPKKLTI